jgi:hypothetical protein
MQRKHSALKQSTQTLPYSCDPFIRGACPEWVLLGGVDTKGCRQSVDYNPRRSILAPGEPYCASNTASRFSSTTSNPHFS